MQRSNDVRPERRSIDELLSEARSRLARLTPHQAHRAQQTGAVLIDIRPEANRETEGRLPGAVVIERTLLEWRLDPASEARLPFASYDRHVVIVCDEGYSSSSLAAVTLQELGIPDGHRHGRRLPSLEGCGPPHELSRSFQAVTRTHSCRNKLCAVVRADMPRVGRLHTSVISA
jgi:rhodanese-related sulfurtransferase